MGIPENVVKAVDQARDALTVRRVFGEPYEKDGVTVIPAAWVRGASGGGGGSDGQGAGGGGTGFGLSARPAGALIIREGRVRWEPAVDVNRIVLGAQLVMLAGILAWRRVARARARSARSAS